MNKWIVLFFTVFFVTTLWNWAMNSGTWVTGIKSSDYAAGKIISGSIIYGDLTLLQNAINGALGDTNIVEAAQIDLDKLERGVLYHKEGYTQPKCVAYGKINVHWTKEDTLPPGATYVAYIHFDDSSAVGSPGFSVTPHIQLGPIYAPTAGLGKDLTYAHWQKMLAGSLHYYLQFASADCCSVFFYFEGGDTIFNNVLLYWEAKQE